MKEKFIEKAFRDSTLAFIEQANDIIEEMMAEGYRLTVRQLHYQFVARDLYENSHANYTRLAATMDDARKAGLVDWEAIEDRTRFLRTRRTFDSPEEFLEAAVHAYTIDLHAEQPYYLEVWEEKDALLGVIERPCQMYRIPYLSCRGYMSSSELYEAGQRFQEMADQGRRGIILHLGDHDPSGVNMSTVNEQAVKMFSGAGVKLERLALNMSQVKELHLPPNYAKETDSRFAAYTQRYGTTKCYELDALPPAYIEKLIQEAIFHYYNEYIYLQAKEQELADERLLRRIPGQWDKISKMLAEDQGDDDERPFDE